MLYDPARHEGLADTTWNSAGARAAIERIFKDTVARVLPDGVWPASPLEVVPDVERGVWIGAAGVIWALHYLAERGFGNHRPDLYATVASLLEPNRARLLQTQWLIGLRAQDLSAGLHGLLVGDTGILLLRGRAGNEDDRRAAWCCSRRER
jgi:hypothetical protein